MDTVLKNAKVKLRCAPHVAHTIRDKLTTPNQQIIWNTTCFSRWLEVNCTQADTMLIHLMFQHEIKSDMNPRTHGIYYNIGGESLRFGPEEFCLLTGLPFGEWNEPLPTLESTFKQRVFGGKSMKVRELKALYDGDLSMFDDVDVVRLSLLLLVEVGFIGTQTSVGITDYFVDLVDDINLWNRYPWGKILWDLTYPSLQNNLHKMSYSVNGFAWVFKVWIYEVLPECRQLVEEYKLTVPRCLSWGNLKKKSVSWSRAIKVMQNVKKQKFRPISLKSNNLEKELAWWVSSVEYIDRQREEQLRQSVHSSGVTEVKLDKLLNLMQEVLHEKQSSTEKKKRRLEKEDEEYTKPSPFIAYKKLVPPKKVTWKDEGWDIQQKARELYDTGKDFKITLTNGSPLKVKFWKDLLAFDGSNGWFRSDHVYAWITYLYYSRKEDATWSILPPWFVPQLKGERFQKFLGNGCYDPYPSVLKVDTVYVPMNIPKKHWFLVAFHLHSWEMKIYDSLPSPLGSEWAQERDDLLDFIDHGFGTWLHSFGYFKREGLTVFHRPKPFLKEFVDSPRQYGSHGIGDCGAWVCIFLERLIKKQALKQNGDVETEACAMNFRMRLGKICYQHIIPDEDPSSGGDDVGADVAGDDVRTDVAGDCMETDVARSDISRRSCRLRNKAANIEEGKKKGKGSR